MRVIVATPPRRRIALLLLTLVLALLACVLGFAEVRTALAQPQEEKQQPQEKGEGGATPQPQPQPNAPQVTQPQLTVSCDPTQGVTFRGTGWRPGAFVELYGFARQPSGYFVEFSGTSIPNTDGVITGRSLDYDPGVYVSLTATEGSFDAQPPNATGQTTCPESPGPGTTTPGGDSGDGDGGGGGGGSGSGSGSGIIAPIGEVFSGLLAGQLPETGGGWAVLLLIVGAVLAGGGWLLVRRFSAS